jgi:predicted membrane-bound mannosyltransferase
LAAALDAHMTIHDALLMMLIIAGMGLSVAYLRAEYILHREFKAAEHRKLIVLRELHAAWLATRQNVSSVATIQIQNYFIEDKSGDRVDTAEAELPSAVCSRAPESGRVMSLRGEPA